MTMGTPCNVIRQGFRCHRRKLMALLFLVLEAASFVVDQVGGNQFGFRVGSFVLSLIGFLMTGYITMGSNTDFESDQIMIELALSVVQLIIAYLYLVLSIFRVELKSNIASIFPVVLAGTILVLAYKRNELVEDPTPNTPQTDEESSAEYQIHDNTISDNPSRVNGEVEMQDTRAFNSSVNASTLVDETPGSRVLHPVTSQSSITVNKEIADPTAAAPTTPAVSFETKLFSNIITTTDLEKELIVPTEAMEHFPIPQGQDFVDLLVKDKEEKFHLTTKPRPVMIEGQLEFVKSTAVVAEDIVTFYKQHNEDSEEQYRVEIKSINK